MPYVKTINFLTLTITILLFSILIVPKSSATDLEQIPGSNQKEENFENALNDAKTAYDNKDYKAALKHLDNATTAVRKIRGKGLTAFFPKHIDGWNIKDDQNEDMVAGAAMFGGGSNLKRTYQFKDQTKFLAKVDLVADSPMLEAITGLMRMATAMSSLSSDQKQNMKSVKIKGHDALIKNEEDLPTQIIVIVDNVMITFETADGAQALEEKHLMHIASNMNYDALK
ncbi:MAG: hypothetical protein AB8B83_09165 [Bdellovibrionales bacterium]